MLYHHHIALKKKVALWSPFTKGCFLTTKIFEIGQVVLKKKIFKCYQVVSFLLLFIWTNLNSFSQGCFEPNLIEIGHVVIEKMMTMLIFLQTGNRQSEKLNWAFSFGELNITEKTFNIVARYRSPCSKVVRAKIRLTFCSLWYHHASFKQASFDINIRYIHSDI